MIDRHIDRDETVTVVVRGRLFVDWWPGAPVVFSCGWDAVRIPAAMVASVTTPALYTTAPGTCPLCGLPSPGHDPGWCAQKSPDPAAMERLR